MSTCNWLDLQTLGSPPIMPKNLNDHWFGHGGWMGLEDGQKDIDCWRHVESHECKRRRREDGDLASECVLGWFWENGEKHFEPDICIKDLCHKYE
jgi:hypothetical protein